MDSHFTIGLDFGTNSVRALIVDVANGQERGSFIYNYARGDAGVILGRSDANLARQHPQDYLRGIEATIAQALGQAATTGNFSLNNVIGIGVDKTGSAPLPLNAAGVALALTPEFENDPNAMAWL